VGWETGMADEDDDFEQPDELEAESDDEEIGDDIDVTAVDDAEEEVVAEVEEEEEEEAAEAAGTRAAVPRGRAKRTDAEALHTVAAREDLRRKLAADVEAFLKRGGAIQDVPQDERAEPAKKAEGNFGRGSPV